MKYRKLAGEDISVLGYGCMRFPTKGIKIDENLAKEQMLYAVNEGINYFDTAYIYHSGQSEVFLGKFLKEYNLREKVFIADKLPTFLIRKENQIESFFNTQLKRLDTNYIDYYLMHMLDSLHSWNTLKDYGILNFIEENKKSGKIKYIGFSFHGRCEEFMKILEDYKWDFCQIQYNYLDEYNQAGIKGLKRAYELGIDVIIMEPLRGGSLASKAPKKVIKKFVDYKENSNVASWAFKWLYNQKEVSVVLSGMNDLVHIKENIKTANDSDINCMTKKELEIVDEVKQIYKDLMKVPCTSCGYCMPCPVNVDIPACFTDYNNKYYFGGYQIRQQYITKSIGGIGYEKSGADLCINCGKCKKHCPQNIDIPKKLKEAHKSLDNIFIRIGLKIWYKLTARKKKK